MRIENVSRRDFLKGAVSTSALVLGASLLPKRAKAAGSNTSPGASPDDALAATNFHPTIFVGLDTDGMVTIIAHRSEMGTGSKTALPRIVADEMDADWSRVRIIQAIGDAKYGSQDTDGSHSVRDFFDIMRQSGASARVMLIQAAAQRWNVPEAECDATMHEVVHKLSGRKLGYGELATAASQLPVPAKESLKFKPKTDWRYIGKDSANYDLKDLCTGKAAYGMDAHVEGMLYASIEHPPVLGGKVKSFDDKDALAVTGVKQTVQIDPFKPPHGFQPLGGIAVIADNTWAAFQGRKKLNVTWDNGANAEYNSDQYRKMLLETARKPGKVARNVGDVDAEFA
ncbi:MAG TPA: molybdopterin cofactor-binding domain-containing protein, partial [Blastocatellia bacterium]